MSSTRLGHGLGVGVEYRVAALSLGVRFDRPSGRPINLFSARPYWGRRVCLVEVVAALVAPESFDVCASALVAWATELLAPLAHGFGPVWVSERRLWCGRLRSIGWQNQQHVWCVVSGVHMYRFSFGFP